VGLLLTDIDHSKGLNDELGLPAGDLALVHVAQLVQASVRDIDTVARKEGDELAVLLTGPAEEVEQRARTVRQKVA